MVDYKGNLKGLNKRKQFISKVELIRHTLDVNRISLIIQQICPVYDQQDFDDAIDRCRYIIHSITSTGRRSTVSTEELAEVLGISKSLAKKTIEYTTRLCVRSTVHPSLSRR